MSIRNNTVGTTEITPVEMEVTKSMKQESRDFSRGRFKPKVQYCDRILQSPEAIAISVIAKDYGKSAKWLNKKLCDMGVQYKQGDVWLLYAKYADKGYTKTDTYMCVDSGGQDHSRIHTKWTQKGRLFLYDLLKANGVIPICEHEEEEIGA